MDGDSTGPPVVPIPGRLDRTMRLGPFASGREALKFLLFAAAAAALASVSAAALAVPVAAIGLFVTLYRPDGQPLDLRLAALARYAVRRIAAERPVNGHTVRLPPRCAVVRVDAARFAAVVRTGGVPLAFLPPEDLSARFDRYRELLRAAPPELAMVATSVPLHPDSLLPPRGSAEGPEADARSGYRELVEVLARRRAVRRVYVGLTSRGSTTTAIAELSVAVGTVIGHLREVGLEAVPLHGRALRAASVRFGWGTGSSGG